MKITAFGEVLWDELPGGRKLGGAPLNLAARLHALGADAAIVSCVGRDADGEAILSRIRALGLSDSLVQTDADQATSRVTVTLSDTGSASYDIVYPCAWDRIRPAEAARQRVAESDVFVHGSLAARDDISYNTLKELVKTAGFTVIDINLRPPHYRHDRLLDMMKAADLIKTNDSELYELAAAYGSPYRSLEQNIRFLARTAGTGRICVTLGEHGAVYFDGAEFHYHGGYTVKVADTVGSGDNFLAGFIMRLFSGNTPKQALEYACALGAMTAATPGPIPDIGPADIEAFINPV